MRSVLNSDSEISDRQAALLTAASLQDVGGTQTGLVLTDERLWHIQSHGVRRVWLRVLLEEEQDSPADLSWVKVTVIQPNIHFLWQPIISDREKQSEMCGSFSSCPLLYPSSLSRPVWEVWVWVRHMSLWVNSSSTRLHTGHRHTSSLHVFLCSLELEASVRWKHKPSFYSLKRDNDMLIYSTVGKLASLPVTVAAASSQNSPVMKDSALKVVFPPPRRLYSPPFVC